MKITLDRINELVKECHEVWDNINFSDDKWREKTNEFDKKVSQLDEDAGEELAPGRELKWGVADGRAHYIVTKVGKTWTELVHLPICDGYHFSGVFRNNNGKLVVPTQIAEQNARGNLGMKKLFAKK